MPSHQSLQLPCFEMHTPLIPLSRQVIRQAQKAKYKPNISRKSRMGGRERLKWPRDSTIKVSFPFPQKEIAKMKNIELKEFLRKHSFPGLQLRPHPQQLWDSFLLYVRLLHWLFPGQRMQLTELNFIPLQVPAECKLKRPPCKTGKSKQCFPDTLQYVQIQKLLGLWGRSNQTKNTPRHWGCSQESLLYQQELSSFVSLPSHSLILLSP